MPKQFEGRFQAQDDFDLAGNHIWNWLFLNDIYHKDVTSGYILATLGGNVTWTAVDFGELEIGTTLTLNTLTILETTSGIDYTELDSIPGSFNPSTHTHLQAEITDLDVVEKVYGGTGISVSANSGDVTITNDGLLAVTAGTGISTSVTAGVATIANTGVLSLSAGTGIALSTSVGAITVTCDILASEVPLVTSGFGGNLSGTDTNVQVAMDTLDDIATTSANLRLFTANIFLSDASTITTGARGYASIPSDGVIQSWDLVADISGDLKLDIWAGSFADWPMTNADSICASAEPEIVSDVTATDATLTGWTTAVSAEDLWIVNVDSATTITQALLAVHILRDTS